MMAFKEITLAHFRKYPLMRPNDLYKLVFQAAMGPGHAVKDIKSVIEWMNDEVKDLEDYDDQDMIEEIDPNSVLVRVNLRPFLKNSGNTDKLCEAFMNTANSFQKQPEKIVTYWNDILELSETGKIAISRDELDAYFAEMRSKGLPAAHHSPVYRLNYKPAYRVVSKEFLDFI
ncbi:MAG: hypothetical protein JXN63_03675 [Candidatus Delongbacteria bacterium]|nr:hypothetical protein [Candidatus Delongbacteria bacterium]